MAVLAARDRLIEAIDAYQDFGVWLIGMLAAAHRRNYVDGVEQATNFKKSLAGDPLPALLAEPIDESEAEECEAE
jgi:hypothetical protein